MATARPLTYMCDDVDPLLLDEFLKWMRLLEVRTDEIDEASIHFPPDVFLIGSRSETATNVDPAQFEDTSYVFLDDDPPRQVAKGVFRITTADMVGATDEWRTLLRIIGRMIGMASISFRAKEIFEEGADSLDLDFEEMEVTLQQQEETKNDRFVNNFANNAGTEFKRLVDAEDYTDESGQAFIAARYAERRGREAAVRACEELGKSFGHTKPDENGTRWGRMKWKDSEFVSHIIYEGETDGYDAHGYGTLRQTVEGVDQIYTGQFMRGERAGFGVGAEGVLTWVGAWFADQPKGHGVLIHGKSEDAYDFIQGSVSTPSESQNYSFKRDRNKKLDGFRVYNRGKPKVKQG